MANNKPTPKPVPGKAKVVKNIPPVAVTPVFPFNFNMKLIILAILSFIFYADSLGNEYALDDGIVIGNNMYVQDGFSGIGKIMTTDAYDSYYKKMNSGQQLSGGRYRPLSEVIFAIEHAIFGEDATHTIHIQRHLFSVLCYVACILVMFYFLSMYLLKNIPYGEDISFFATIFFAIHPIHTEVVANVKSLDEILSLLLICLTFIFSLRYMDSKKIRDLALGLICYFLSLLAKEYAVTLAILLPMVFYLLRTKKLSSIFLNTLPYYAVLVIYMIMRYKAVGFNGHVESAEILDNPYLLATHAQKLATEYFMLGKYLWMLFVPYPLISDYSYNSIPYRSPTDILVIFTQLFYIASIVWGIRLLSKRNPLAFAVFFYLFCLSLVSNLVMDIGATMGERLIFHSSFGFSILLSYGLFQLIKKWGLQKKRSLAFGLSCALIVVFGYQTMARNLEWKNDVTLFTHDVTIGTESIMLNGNAGARYIDLGQKAKDSINKRDTLLLAIKYLRKSIFLHKRSAYVSSYLNMGDAYYELQMPDSAKIYWEMVKRVYPDYPDIERYFLILGRQYLSKATHYGEQHNYAAATREIYKGIKVNPTDAELWYNLGGAYFTGGNYDSAYLSWKRTLELDPNQAEAKKGMASLVPVKKTQ